MTMHEWYKLAPDEQWLRDDALTQREALEIWNALALREGVLVFDCPCGRGQMSRPLARLGARVTGMDLNPRFIEEARQGFASEGLEATFHVGDMRDASCEEGCDLLLNWFNSFGYFESDAENLRVLRRFAHCLRPGGILLMENPNPTDILEHIQTKWDASGVVVHRWDAATKRINSLVNGVECSVRIYTHEEYAELFRAVGLLPINVWGEHFTPFTDASRRMIMAARKLER